VINFMLSCKESLILLYDIIWFICFFFLTQVTWDGGSVDPPKEEVVVTEKGKAEMICDISGYPVPTIAWKKDDTVITGSS